MKLNVRLLALGFALTLTVILTRFPPSPILLLPDSGKSPLLSFVGEVTVPIPF